MTGATDLFMVVCLTLQLWNQRLTGRVTSEWQRVSVPISRLVSDGLELAYVDTGLVFWPADRVAVDLEIDNVIWRTSDPVTDAGGDDSDTDLDLSGLTGPTSPGSYEGYTLLWSDEFSGTVLDSRYWNYNIGDRAGAATSGTPTENASLNDGYLVITAKRELRQ